MKINRIIVCGSESPEISAKFNVHCTESPGHEGDHRTIYSVNPSAGHGFEYRWHQLVDAVGEAIGEAKFGS